MADRPTAAVITTLSRIEDACPENIDITYLESPEPIRTSKGCRWSETMQFMYGHLKDGGSQAGMIWDDDLVFSDAAMDQLHQHLHFFEHDRVEAEWLNIADEEARTYDSAFLKHTSTHLFRMYKEDDWSDVLTKTIGGGGTASPIFVARSQNFTTITGRVLHLGYCSPDRRQHSWNAAKACGQTDGYFRQLARDPEPTRCSGRYETSRTLSRHLAGLAAQ